MGKIHKYKPATNLDEYIAGLLSAFHALFRQLFKDFWKKKADSFYGSECDLLFCACLFSENYCLKYLDDRTEVTLPHPFCTCLF